MQKIILFGGSFNPPGIHHEDVFLELRRKYPGERIVIVPCGPRKDKNNQRVSLHDRIEMTESAFESLYPYGIELDLFDLENDCFTSTHDLDERYSRRGDIFHFVGTDIIAGGAQGKSEIHRVWERREQDFNKLNFVVGGRIGTNWTNEDLPPNCDFVSMNIEGSSTEIRDQIASGNYFRDLVKPRVWEKIVDCKLYGYSH